MGDDLLELSGFVDPKVLLKALGKAKRKMELKWIQFGQCSSFLDGPDPRHFQKEAPPVPRQPSPPPPPPRVVGLGYPYHQGVAPGYHRGVPPSYYDDGISSCNMM